MAFRNSPAIRRSEAHLPAFRPRVPVRFIGTVRRRSRWGWVLFFGLIVLNEARGVYVVAQFLKAWNS